MKIGFYNKGAYTASDATFTIFNCLDKNGGSLPASTTFPSVASISQNVGGSSAAAYSVILSAGDADAATYICTIGVKCGSTSPTTCLDATIPCGTDKCYETKQFFLKLTS